MANEWAKHQSQDSGVQSRLVSILEDLLSQKLSPKDSAAKIASTILSEVDAGTPWTNLIALNLNAAKTFSDEEHLHLLVDYLVELASLPDAINESSEAKTSDVTGKTVLIAPGQSIVFEEGKLWSDLPTFSRDLTEGFRGGF